MKKKLSIALLAFSLAMLCANFLVRRVGSFLPPSEQEIEEMEEENDFSPFALVKQEDKETEENTEEKPVLTLQEQAEFKEKEIIKPILKFELTEEEKQTVENYTKNPKMQEFIKEISTVVSQEELDQENYLQIVYKPEVRDIFMKYAQDEEFREIASEIMKDKDLLKLAKQKINNREVKR